MLQGIGCAALFTNYTGAAVGSLGLTLGVAVFSASFGSALAKLPGGAGLAEHGVEKLHRLAPLLSLSGGVPLAQATAQIQQGFLAAYGSAMLALLWLCAAALLYLARHLRKPHGAAQVVPLV
ncbi:hypothetical protein OL229_19950 [Neisseriaceae bacterium JH1-16]|nr:hypothetical protein [Neisseriaceae bacterium JH1-16]